MVGLGISLFRHNCRDKILLRVVPEQTEGCEEADTGTGNSSHKFRKGLQGSNAIAGREDKISQSLCKQSDRGPGKDMTACLKR